MMAHPRPYNNSAKSMQDCVDDAYEAVVSTFKEHGFKVNQSDPAEELVDAIYKFLKASGN